jgi:multidrug efflux pump subunit AcrB
MNLFFSRRASLLAGTILLLARSVASAADNTLTIEVRIPAKSMQAERVEVELAGPIEREIAKLKGVDKIHSTSSYGDCRLMVTFKDVEASEGLATVNRALRAAGPAFRSAQVKVLSRKS